MRLKAGAIIPGLRQSLNCSPLLNKKANDTFSHIKAQNMHCRSKGEDQSKTNLAGQASNPMAACLISKGLVGFFPSALLLPNISFPCIQLSFVISLALASPTFWGFLWNLGFIFTASCEWLLGAVTHCLALASLSDCGRRIYDSFALVSLQVSKVCTM